MLFVFTSSHMYTFFKFILLILRRILQELFFGGLKTQNSWRGGREKEEGKV